MSLFIVGSCSRITNGIIKSLIAKNLYTRIVIGDIFPTYCAFQRYYKLREQIAQIKNGNTHIKPVKLIDENDIYLWCRRADHILYVTHDYYQNVTAKTKLMEITADAAKERPNVLYVTPVEYDQFRYSKPEEKYQEAVHAVRKKCPQATIIRSDVVAGAELHSFISSPKWWLSQYVLWRGVQGERFWPKLVKQQALNEAVGELLTKEVHGKDFNIRGDKEVKMSEFKLQGKPFETKCTMQIQQFRKAVEKYNANFSKGVQFKIDKLKQAKV